MSNRESWEQQLEQLGSEHDRVLIQRLSKEDPALADELRANLIQAHLDEIGLQKASPQLSQTLYGITSNKPHQRLALQWSAWIGAAAVLMLAVWLTPWQQRQPSAQDIALARQQVDIALYYLQKTAGKTAVITEQSIALGVQTAMDSTPFAAPDDDQNIEL